MSGSPITFKGQHPLNAIILVSIIILIYYYAHHSHPIFFGY